MGEGGKTFLRRTKTKELMEDEVECKDGITPFESLILRSMYLYYPKQEFLCFFPLNLFLFSF